MFGVAVGARAFPGVIVVHANADYILNFKNEIGVQRQIEELGQQSEIDYVALLDSSLKFVAHTDRGLVDKKETDPTILKVGAVGQELSRIVALEGGKQEYQMLKPMRMNGSAVGFLKIGLSLDPVDIAWRNSLSSMAVLGLAILTVGIFGLVLKSASAKTRSQLLKTCSAPVLLIFAISMLFLLKPAKISFVV